VDYAVFGEAAEHGVGLGVGGGLGWGLRCGGVGRGFEWWRGGLAGGVGTLHSAVHGFVGEAVGVLVFVAEGVGDLEGLEFGDSAFGFVVKGLEVGAFDLVFALDLLDHELGIADDAEAGVVVVEGVLQAAEEAGVFGVVVGAHAEEFGEFGDDHAFVVLDEGTVAGGARVAAGSAVAVGVDPVGGCGFLGGGFREEAGGGGRAGRHWVSLPDEVVGGQAGLFGLGQESGSRFARMPQVGARKMGHPGFGRQVLMLTFFEWAGLLEC
jgi:hypothetical protein